MKKSFLLATGFVITLLISGCQTSKTSLSIIGKPLSLQQQAALTINKDYETALRAMGTNGGAKQLIQTPTTSDSLTTGTVDTNTASTGSTTQFNSVFGPRIGQFFLADEYVVYRHARPQSGANAELTQSTPIELTYFLVSPKGVIEDYATGQSDVTQSSCIQIYAVQAIICDEPERLSEDFDRFDNEMQTSKSNGIGVWNVSSNAAEAQLIDPFVSAEQGSATEQ